jgi:hypothetical protein
MFYPIKLCGVYPWVSGLVRQNARVLSIAMRKSILRNPHEQADRTRDYPPQAARPAPAPRYASARASYPVFLAFHDTLRLQIGWAWRGLVDAFRWDIVVGLMTRNVCRSTFFFSPVCWLTVCMQRCRGPRECAQVFLAQRHLPSVDLCL